MDGRSRQNPAYRPTKERAPILGRVLLLGAALAIAWATDVSAETPRSRPTALGETPPPTHGARVRAGAGAPSRPAAVMWGATGAVVALAALGLERARRRRRRLDTRSSARPRP